MARREIIQLDNPILRRKANRVTTFDSKLQTLVNDMIETILDENNPGVGLAAPQVAVSQRLIVVRLPDDEESKQEYGRDAGHVYVLANPEIIKESREVVEGYEACLSIPGYFGKVKRHESVVIKGLDRYGKPIRVKAKGYLARVFQHELDHLDGRLYIDIASAVYEAQHGDEDDEQTVENAKSASQLSE